MSSNTVLEYLLLKVGESFKIRDAFHLYRPADIPFRPYFVYRLTGRESNSPPMPFDTTKSGYDSVVGWKMRYLTTVEVSCVADSHSKVNNALAAITALDFAGEIESVANLFRANEIEFVGANEMVGEQDWDESYTLYQFTRTLEFREWSSFTVTTEDIYADRVSLSSTLFNDAGDDITLTIEEP